MGVTSTSTNVGKVQASCYGLPSLDQITVIRMIEGHLSVVVADGMFVIMSLRVLAFLATPQAVVIL